MYTITVTYTISIGIDNDCIEMGGIEINQLRTGGKQ